MGVKLNFLGLFQGITSEAIKKIIFELLEKFYRTMLIQSEEKRAIGVFSAEWKSLMDLM